MDCTLCIDQYNIALCCNRLESEGSVGSRRGLRSGGLEVKVENELKGVVQWGGIRMKKL